MIEILFCYYKQFVSYERAKTKKVSDFFALTWLIFAGPVTYVATYGTSQLKLDTCFGLLVIVHRFYLSHSSMFTCCLRVTLVVSQI